MQPDSADSAILTAVARDFLPYSQIFAFLALGTLAGGFGAIFSLRRELTEYEPTID